MKPTEPDPAGSPLRRVRTSRQKMLLLAAVVVGGLSLGVLVELLIAHATSAATLMAAQAPASLNEVINNLRNVIVGLLVALATLFATVGGLRYMLAQGDPGEAEAAKKCVRNAAIGYGLAILAPLLVEILKGIVGA
ncbi:pilin [Herbidospora cretacea]|uniref:pilin n=1 Tax=Herbidospora cretacea TaxID=28444 RepID=UPI000B1FBFAD|nr:pilin [Herbidospora cretacea]